MNTRWLRIPEALALGLLLGGTLVAPPAWADPSGLAQFQGYVAINRVLEERLIRGNQPFELATYLDEGGKTDLSFLLGGGLASLLGTYNGGTLDGEFPFRNGNPNVANMVLWHVALSGLAEDLGALCGPPPDAAPSPLAAKARPELLDSLKAVCAWPAPSAQADDALLGLWFSLMSFDAPQSEFEAWRDFFRGPAYARTPARETVAAMALAAFDNPYFLLRK